MALEESGIAPEEVEAILCATVTPDQPAPANAQLIQANIGACNTAAFDLNAACSGYLFGLSVANAYIASGMYKNVLLVGAETISRLLNWNDRSTAVLFADGAGATMLKADTSGHGVLTSHIGSDGTAEDILNIPQGGWKYKRTAEHVAANPTMIGMDGQELFKRAVRTFCDEIELTLKTAEVSVDDIALFVPHQANARISEAVRARVGLPEEKLFMNIDHTGNTAAASIPMALHEAKEAGRIHEGDLVLMAAFGAGLTWASALVRW